jgi:hypothetical protein
MSCSFRQAPTPVEGCVVSSLWHLERRRRRDSFVLSFAKASVRHASAPRASVLAASAPTPWSSRMTPMNVGLIRTFVIDGSQKMNAALDALACVDDLDRSTPPLTL